MSGMSYRDQSSNSYSNDQQAGASQGPAAQHQMWQSRQSDLRREWLAFDPTVQARAADEMGLSPVINQGLLPTDQQMAGLIEAAKRHQGAASEEVPGVGVSPELIGQAKQVLVQSQARSQGATSRYRAHEAQGGSFWGAASGMAAEWMGGQEQLDPTLEADANMANAKLEALINQGEAASRPELMAQMKLAHQRSMAFSNAVGQYTGGMEEGREESIDALETTRDTSASVVGALATPAGAGVVGGALIGGASSAAFQGVTEVAAVEAGVQDGDGLKRIGAAGVEGVAGGLISGPVAQGASKALAPKLVPTIMANSSAVAGRQLSKEAAEDVLGRAVDIVVGQGMSGAQGWAGQQDNLSADALAEHVNGAYGDAIVKKALELASEQEAAAAK